MIEEPTYQWTCPSCGKRYQILAGRCAPELCPSCVKLSSEYLLRPNSLFAVERAAAAKQAAIVEAPSYPEDEPQLDEEPVKWACPKCGTEYPLAAGLQNTGDCPKCQEVEHKRAVAIQAAPERPKEPRPETADTVPGRMTTLPIWLCVALLAAQTFILFMAHLPTLQPDRWEYRIESPNDRTFVETLDRVGADGWELVSARRARNEATDQFEYEMILKRRR